MLGPSHCRRPCTRAVLAATAITGVLQALVGGQPLLIVGVAEPIVLTWGYMYSFAKDQEGGQLANGRVALMRLGPHARLCKGR